MTNGADEQIAHGPGTGKILLVGDIQTAFLDAGALAGERYEVCANVEDAIDAAEKKNFAAIAVVIAAVPAKLSAALKDLRDCSDPAWG